MSEEDTVTVPCEAQCHMLSLKLDTDEGLVYLSFFVSTFYAKQESLVSRLKERAKIIGTVLLGREYQFEDIVLSPESAQQLATFLNGVSWNRMKEARHDN